MTELQAHKRILIIFSRAPYSSATGQEGLDALLTGAAFEYEVSVLFVHDGVYQLKNNQQTESSGLKLYTKTFSALPDFEVQKYYLHDTSLTARGLIAEQLSLQAEPIDRDAIAALIKQQDKVFTF